MTWVEFGREVLIDEDNNHVVYAYGGECWFGTQILSLSRELSRDDES